MTTSKRDTDIAALEAQIAQLRAEFAQVAETMTAVSQTGAATLRAALGEKAQSLREEGAEKLAGIGQSAEVKLAEVTDYARRNPVNALAMAGGAGLLLGLLFGRR